MTEKSISIDQKAGVRKRELIEFSWHEEMPKEYQGHWFLIEAAVSTQEKPTGPFRLEFVLFSTYADLQAMQITQLEIGYTNLVMNDQMLLAFDGADLAYNTPRGPQKARLSIWDSSGRIQKLVIEVNESTLNESLNVSYSAINSFLDFISFKFNLPMSVKQVDIYQSTQNTYYGSYVPVPYYQDIELSIEDVASGLLSPKPLKPLFSLYRNAVNATDQSHRLLSFFRIYEGLKKLREKNNEAIKIKDATPTREKVLIPENLLTSAFFSEYIGKGAEVFLDDYVTGEFRRRVAHFDLDEYEKLTFDPHSMQDAQRLEFVNAILSIIMHGLIVTEIDLMRAHNLI